jgi:hypothetical protein
LLGLSSNVKYLLIASVYEPKYSSWTSLSRRWYVSIYRLPSRSRSISESLLSGLGKLMFNSLFIVFLSAAFNVQLDERLGPEIPRSRREEEEEEETHCF